MDNSHFINQILFSENHNVAAAPHGTNSHRIALAGWCPPTPAWDYDQPVKHSLTLLLACAAVLDAQRPAEPVRTSPPLPPSLQLYVAAAPPPSEPIRTALLWPGGAPGAVGDEDSDKPTLSIYLPPPARAVGTGIVICPGGAYSQPRRTLDHEGDQVARWLNSIGVAAFVLKYRGAPRYRHPAPLQDVQRAIRDVRHHAREYGVPPDRIGVCGFSAGGHLASTAATHFDGGQPTAVDPIDRQSSRPDFLILAYPVISFTTPYVSRNSFRSLLGDNPAPGLVESLSSEKQVTPQTPPTFLFHTNEDRGVFPENSVLFYLALRKVGVPVEMHIYERGPHGVGLASLDRTLSSWAGLLAEWLRGRGLLIRPNS